MNNAERMVVLFLKHPGNLQGFETNDQLTNLVINDLKPADFPEIAKLRSLNTLITLMCELDNQTIPALLEMNCLRKLELEDSNFSDADAKCLSVSTNITSLDVGATQLTATGLQSLLKMQQLEHLDIWGNDISEHDLEMLAELPNLKSLSIGGHPEQDRLTADGVIPILKSFNSLERIWMDGIPVNDEQYAFLRENYQIMGPF
ncbi:MAG: hypothetical protein QNJ29_03310 [Rhizobiaceae bacterium]|nr:hypothetical protein [Rhizobiaceae bacterium]